MPLELPESVLSAPTLLQFSLAGKLCFVTGGARGFGLEIVRAFAEAGADVCFTYLTTPKHVATQVAQSIHESTGRHLLAIRADVTQRADIANAMEEAVQAFSSNSDNIVKRNLDVVVANAGVCRQISSLEYDEETFDKDFAVNVYGVMWTAQAAGKIFRAQGHGNLIITASVSSVLVNTPQPQTSYNSSKAAAAHMGKNLAVEWVDFARVNCVSPGYVATNMTLSQPELIRNQWTSQIPARRMADPRELKGLYVFLASNASSYMTGANVIIDGAFSLP